MNNRLGWGSVLVLTRSFMFLARLLPRSVALRVFGFLGGLFFYFFKKDRTRSEVNLSLAFPGSSRQEIRTLARRVFTELGRNCVDALRMPGATCRELNSFVRIEGLARFEEALSRGNGVIVVTGHIGCWELLAAHFSMLGYPLAVIVRPLRDERLETLIDGLRRSKGMKPISRMDNVKAAYSWLKRGGTLGVLIDQDTSVKGVFCNFFGRPAYTAAGPAYLAFRTGAVILPMAIQLEEDGTQVVRVKEPIDIPRGAETESGVRSIMQTCTDKIEDYIRLRPAQWVWMHERWKTSPASESDTVKGNVSRGKECAASA